VDHARPEPSPDSAAVEAVRGHLDGLGPSTLTELAAATALRPTLVEMALARLESEGFLLRGRFDVERRPEGEEEFCARRLLARIHLYTQERLRREIERQLQRLALVQEMIAELEAERDAVLVAPAAEPAAHKIQHLAKLKSIGPETATVLGREIFYRGYDTRRQIGAYAGLAPSPFNSGRMVRDQGISKAGNRRARTTMIELAWLWLRYQPDSALSQWFRERVGGAKGRLKRIMIVALARKLLVALWRYVETGLVPTGAVLKV